MDAILVCGETQNEHDKNLTAALTRIQEADFTLNKEKCKFNKTAIKFLGQVVDSSSIIPDPDKIKAISHMPQPKISQN